MSARHRITGIRQWRGERARVKGDYLISLEILNDALRDNKTIRTAAMDDGRLSYPTVMRYVGEATERDAFGRTVPKRANRLFHPMEMLDARGDRVLRGVYGSRRASLVGAHQAAISTFLDTGDERVLEPFRERRVAGVELASDPDVIEQAAREGSLDDLEPYPRGDR
jgi:hypothetical protein